MIVIVIVVIVILAVAVIVIFGSVIIILIAKVVTYEFEDDTVLASSVSEQAFCLFLVVSGVSLLACFFVFV